MRVLVTGAFGFSGSYLVPHLIDNGDEVYGAYQGEKPKGELCTAVELDIRDADHCRKMVKEISPEAIYHLAAVTFVPEAERDFEKTLSINVGGTYNLIKALQDLKTSSKFLFISSSEVYGKIEPQNIPIKESVELNPTHNYSLTKAMGELLVRRYNSSQLKVVIARAFNHIGPRQRVDFVVSAFANQLAKIAKGELKPTVRVGNLEAKRDFTDVRDVVLGYRSALLNGTGVYNFCSGRSVSIQCVLDTLIKISGIDVRIEQVPDKMRPSEVAEIRGDFTRAREDLGWNPSIPLEESLKLTYEYWLERV